MAALPRFDRHRHRDGGSKIRVICCLIACFGPQDVEASKEEIRFSYQPLKLRMFPALFNQCRLQIAPSLCFHNFLNSCAPFHSIFLRSCASIPCCMASGKRHITTFGLVLTTGWHAAVCHPGLPSSLFDRTLSVTTRANIHADAGGYI